MKTQTEVMIYLAENRGCTQNNTHRSFHTLNFGNFNKPHLKPFYDLLSLNEDTLKGGCATSIPLAGNTGVFLLPTEGGVYYKLTDEDDKFLQAGECTFVTGKANSTLRITNPYEDQLVNYLSCFIRIHETSVEKNIEPEFSLDDNKDVLHELIATSHVKISLGKFTGRKDYCIQKTNESRGIFAFVLEGAFEFENRLLHPKDGLAIHSRSVVEFEALSNDAILMILELK